MSIDNFEYENRQAEIDRKSDDFPTIKLTHSELVTLSKINAESQRASDVSEPDASRLLHLNFIKKYRTCFTDKENFEFYEIRWRGRNYLAYVIETRKESRGSRLNEWLLAIVGAILGAILGSVLTFWFDHFDHFAKLAPIFKSIVFSELVPVLKSIIQCP